MKSKRESARHKLINNYMSKVIMNSHQYESEYESEDIYEYDSDASDAGPTQSEIDAAEKRQIAQAEIADAQRLQSERLRLKKELGTITPYLLWAKTGPVLHVHTVASSLKSIEHEQADEGGWKTTSNNKHKQVEIKTTKKGLKPSMCHRKDCSHPNCWYAHTIDELYITDCEKGRGCPRIQYVNDMYTNKTHPKFKTNVCERIHFGESIENFTARLVKRPVTDEEMDSDWRFIQKFMDSNRDVQFGFKTLFNPETTNVLSAFSSNYLKKRKNSVAKPYIKYQLPPPRVTPLSVRQATAKSGSVDISIKKNLGIIEANLKTIRSNESLILRFKQRSNNVMCIEKVTSLTCENEMLLMKNDKMTKENLEASTVQSSYTNKKQTKVGVTAKMVTASPPRLQIVLPAGSIVHNVIAKMQAPSPSTYKDAVDRTVSNVTDIPAPKKFEKLSIEAEEVDIYGVLRRELCKSFVRNFPCHMQDKCRYAHSIEDLAITSCHFGYRCTDVIYENEVVKNRSLTKVCQRLHPNETDNDVRKRMSFLLDTVSPPVTQSLALPYAHMAEKGWTTVKSSRRPPIALRTTTDSITKTELCAHGIKCRRRDACTYAHNLRELNIVSCRFGSRCTNINCTRMHGKETKEDVIEKIRKSNIRRVKT